MTERITQLDFSVLYWIQDVCKCPFLDFLMPKITFLGNAGIVWIIAAGIMLLIPRYRRAGILLISGLAAGVLTGNLIMKPLIARPRPCFVDTTVQMLISAPGIIRSRPDIHSHR